MEARLVHDTRYIISVDAAACEMFRCEEIALCDLSLLELIDDRGGMRGLAKLRLRVLREKGSIPIYSYPFRRCDGSIFWASVTSKMLEDGTAETIIKYKYED